MANMSALEIVFGVIILVFALFLVIAVLMQHGKSKNLSGTIAGGAETFFGKEKGKTIDRILSTVTTIIAVIFVIAVLILYVLQPRADASIETAAVSNAIKSLYFI